MKTLFAVPWIEVEYGWGSRDEGYKVFGNLEDCKLSTKREVEKGNYPGGYIGPVKPVVYYEIPETEEFINKSFPLFVNKLQFKSDARYFQD